MKFTEHLSAHITPEWRSRYMNYEEMKDIIKKCFQNLSNIGTKYYIKSCEKKFFEFCSAELNKVDSFFTEKLSEVKRKFVELKRTILTAKKSNVKLTKKTLNQFRFDLSEFYLSLILLQNFQKLNYTGFRNILRYHDKILNNNFGELWLPKVHKTNFFLNNEVNILIKDCENFFINELENGDRKQAMERLRLPPFKEVYNLWTIFRIGFCLGAVFLLILCEILIYIETNNDIKWYHAMPLYRGSFFIILQLFLWCINMHVYRKYGINQILIFQIDPRKHVPINDLMELGAIFALLWAISIYIFIYENSVPIPTYLPPILLYLIMLLYICNPTKTLLYSSRIWALHRFTHLILAPTYFVTFPEFWIGDQLNSIRLLLLDIKYTFCFVRQNPEMIEIGENDVTCHGNKSYSSMIIEMLPPWFRFAQVIRRYRDTGFANPHLLNACKFTITLTTICIVYTYRRNDKPGNGLTPWFCAMLVFMFINTISNIMWDLKIDWGVLQVWKGKKIFLREQLCYPQPFYYMAIIENIIIRFDLFAQIIVHYQFLNRHLTMTIMALLEILRRFIWNFFRLENEHFNNCGMFRAHRDISVRAREAALFTDDKLNEEYIREELMDELIELVIKDPKQLSKLLIAGDMKSYSFESKSLFNEGLSFLRSRKGSLKGMTFNENELKKRTDDGSSLQMDNYFAGRQSQLNRADDLLILEYDTDDD